MSELSDKQKKDLEMRQCYRNAFATLWSYEEGQKFVKDLFANKLMFLRDDIKGEGELAISNLGRKLFGYIGSTDIGVSLNAVLSAQLNTTLHIEKKKEVKDET